jgi:hypothetical protein
MAGKTFKKPRPKKSMSELAEEKFEFKNFGIHIHEIPDYSKKIIDMYSSMGITPILAKPPEPSAYEFEGKTFHIDESMLKASEDFSVRAKKRMIDEMMRGTRSLDPIDPLEKIFKYPEGDIEPEWEMDIASGAIRSHDLVVDEKGNEFFVTDGILKPFNNEGRTYTPVGSVKIVNSSTPELPGRGAFAHGGIVPSGLGILDAMKDVKPTLYEPLTRKSFDEFIDDMKRRPAHIVETPRHFGKSFVAAAAASVFDEDALRKQMERIESILKNIHILWMGTEYSIATAPMDVLEYYINELRTEDSDIPEDELNLIHGVVSAEIKSRRGHAGTDIHYMSTKGISMKREVITPEEFRERYLREYEESSPPKSPSHGGGPGAVDSEKWYDRVISGLMGRGK